MKGTWQTSGGGGSVAGTVIGGGLVILGAAAVLNALPHVLTAGGNFLRALAQLVLAATVSIIALGVTAFFLHRAYRQRHPAQLPWRAGALSARQVIPPSTGPMVDPPPPATHALPAAQPGGLHVHFHGLDHTQAAAILRDAQEQ